MSQPSRREFIPACSRSISRDVRIEKCCAARAEYARLSGSFNARRERICNCCAFVTRNAGANSHAVALEHLAARSRQLGAVGLQAALHRTVIAEILAAQPRGVARAGLL